MIIGFVGTPGSGKSYEAVKKILDNIKLGRRVYTNVEGLDQPKCRKYIQEFCNVTEFQLEKCLIHLSDEEATHPELHCEPGSLVLIDEVHKLLSNRNWQSEENKTFAEWASTHRHQGYDLVLITQSLDKVDKHIRSLIEWTYFYRKMNMFGAAMQHKYLCYTYAGDEHNGKPMTKNVRTYDKRIFPAYQSYSDEEVKELGFMKHTNMLKHPVFLAVPVILAITLYFFSKSSFVTGDFLGTGAIAERSEKQLQELKERNTKININPQVQVNQGKRQTGSITTTYNFKSSALSPQVTRMAKYKRSDGSIFYSNVTPPAGARFLKFM